MDGSTSRSLPAHRGVPAGIRSGEIHCTVSRRRSKRRATMSSRCLIESNEKRRTNNEKRINIADRTRGHIMRMRITLAALFGVCMATLVAQQNQAPEFPRASDALERVTWRTRTLVANDRFTNWDVAIPGMGLTFQEAVVRADAALVPFVEASSTQRVSPQVQKSLDYNLTDAEIASVKTGIGPNVRVS